MVTNVPLDAFRTQSLEAAPTQLARVPIWE